MVVDRLVRLAVPVDAAADAFVDVGERAGAGLGHAAADHQPVGVEAVHQHVAVRPALELRRDNRSTSGRSSSSPVQARSVKAVAVGDRDAAPFEDRAVRRGADEADRLRRAP